MIEPARIVRARARVLTRRAVGGLRGGITATGAFGTRSPLVSGSTGEPSRGICPVTPVADAARAVSPRSATSRRRADEDHLHLRDRR